MQQDLYDYKRGSYLQNDTEQIDFVIDEKDSQHEVSLQIPKHYNLFIYIDSESQELKDLYINAAYKHNLVVQNYLEALANYKPSMEKYCFNAGFDLFCPEDTESIGSQKVVLDHKIKCCMRVVGENEQFVSYYLYCRSSLPLKTPLRLANNVGIIDSGYRGNIKGVFDNIQGYDFMDYTIEFGSRLLQICPPNLEYPMKIIIVDNVSHLGETERGEGGFGSTGN
jgi:dUTP pyrophosphatase